MTGRLEVYACELCGNVVEMVRGAAGTLVCCGQPMKKKEEQTADWATEKHVPIAEAQAGGTLVKVGSTAHPMVDDHYIEWIEIINGDYVNRKHLKPGDKPEASFYVPCNDTLVLREYCNKHGLWRGGK